MTRTWVVLPVLAGSWLVCAASASADVTITGTVYYLDMTELGADGAVGVFKPAANTRVVLEFDHWHLLDEESWTDEAGKYEFTGRNPHWGTFRVKIEVRAEVKLGRVDSGQIRVACYAGHTAMYPFNGDTDWHTVGADETLTLDIYVAPRCPARTNTLTRFDYGDDGGKTLIALFAVQKVREAFNWFVDRAPTAGQLSRNTTILYSGRSGSSYEPYPYIYLVQWGNDARIHLAEQSQMFPDNWLGGGADVLPGRWQNLRSSVTHEYAHKVMHDVYWAWPEPYKGSGGHSANSCTNGVTGWVEGWAGFCCAAVWGHATLRGRVAAGQGNLEHSWHPTTQPWTDPLQLPGTIEWRQLLDRPNARDTNETEVAAVLWDVYDPKGWEFLPAEQQDARPPGVPPLRWYDRIEDPNLDRIWKIVADDNPDCLIDEDDTWEDGFTYYWRTRHCGDKDFWGRRGTADPELDHGYKAILLNRGIPSRDRPQRAPRIIDFRRVAATARGELAALTVAEDDPEDRPFLYYNVAIGREGADLEWFFTEDRPLTGTWSDERLSTTIMIPPVPSDPTAADAWQRMVLVVHDSMQCAFLEKSVTELNADGPVRAVTIASRGDTAYLLRADGRLLGWGNNYGAELGVGERSRPNVGYWPPAGPTGVADVVRFAVSGNKRSIALCADGTVWIWGDGFRPLQTPSPLPPSLKTLATALPVRYTGWADVRSLALGHSANWAALADGTVWGWTATGNHPYLVGPPREDWPEMPRPVQIPGLADVAEIVAGTSFALALRRDGTVWACGYNRYGETGRPFIEGQESDPSPQAVPGLTDVVAVSTHSNHCLALKRDGTVWAWGYNRTGQLGDGTRRDTHIPVQVQGLGRAVAVAAALDCSLALLEDGTVWQWGEILSADTVKGKTIGRRRYASKPVQVQELSDAVAITAGLGNFLAIRADGSVWGWGGVGDTRPGVRSGQILYLPTLIEGVNAFATD